MWDTCIYVYTYTASEAVERGREVILDQILPHPFFLRVTHPTLTQYTPPHPHSPVSPSHTHLEPCLSCPGSSVGSGVSWVRVPPRAAPFSFEKELSWLVLRYALALHSLIHTIRPLRLSTHYSPSPYPLSHSHPPSLSIYTTSHPHISTRSHHHCLTIPHNTPTHTPITNTPSITLSLPHTLTHSPFILLSPVAPLRPVADATSRRRCSGTAPSPREPGPAVLKPPLAAPKEDRTHRGPAPDTWLI